MTSNQKNIETPMTPLTMTSQAVMPGPEHRIQRRSVAGPSTLAALKALSPKPATLAKNVDHMPDIVKAKKPDKSALYITDGKVYVTTEIPGHKEALCVKYSEEFDYIAVGYSDGIIKLYNSVNGHHTVSLSDEDVKDNRAPVTSIKHRPVNKSYPPSNCYTATYANGCVKCWSYNFGQCLYTIREKRQTFGIVYHPRYPKFVTFGDNMKIYFYDEESKTQERVLTSSDKSDKHDGHVSRVFAACFHPRNNYELLTGGWDDVVCFWDLRQPHAVRHVSGVHMCGEGIDISQKGSEFVTCSWQKEKAIQLFDYGSGKLIATYDPDIHYSKLYCGKYATKDFIVTAGTDPNLFRVVDLKTMATSAIINQLPGAVYSLDVGAPKQVKVPQKVEKGNIKNDITLVPKMTFIAGKNLYQVDFA